MKQETDYMFEMMQKMIIENERAATAQLNSFERLVNIMRAKNGLTPLPGGVLEDHPQDENVG